jgi:hypothetical protein
LALSPVRDIRSAIRPVTIGVEKDVPLHRVLASTGADELLGLVSSLLPLGTAGIIAAVVPLNDHALVPVMVDVHQQLKAGRTFAEALYHVRRGPVSDPIQQATAQCLVALGAA